MFLSPQTPRFLEAYNLYLPSGVPIDNLLPMSRRLQIEVPNLFRCPISLEVMRDPVTLCTGQTYDRSSIEKWLEEGHNTCPITMQLVENQSMLPNHTFRRLIQDWCVANRSKGVERIPTPKLPATPRQVQILLQQISLNSPREEALKTLRSLAKENIRNPKCITAAGAGPVLASALASCNLQPGQVVGRDVMDLCDDAIGTLILLPLDQNTVGKLVSQKVSSTVGVVLSRGNLDAKVNAAILVEKLCTDGDARRVIGETEGLIGGLVRLLKEALYRRAVKASLGALQALCVVKRNSVLAAENGAVSALVEMIPDADTKNAERALEILDLLCSRRQGRDAAAEHALVIPMLSKVCLKVSHIATDCVVRVLWAVLHCHSAQNDMQMEAAVETGIFSTLLLLIQTDCCARTKQRASDVLRTLGPLIRSQYPSCVSPLCCGFKIKPC
eukprot:Gb_16349 [translate_table: standard]